MNSLFKTLIISLILPFSAMAQAERVGLFRLIPNQVNLSSSKRTQ